MSKIGVLGAGTWGTALAIMLAQNAHSVTLWSALDDELNTLKATHTHPNLKGSVIPESMVFTNDISEVCSDKDVLLFAVASPYVRATAEKAAPFIKEGQIIVDAAKGLEEDTLFTMSQVIKDGIGKEVTVVALSGPTHAEEVALGLPTTVVAACRNLKAAEQVQNVFMNTCMRVYTNEDILGVELCGALKNIIALACGISTGLGFGDNAKAAIITRGIAEMSRLGMAMKCDKMTFAGLAGLGDLIVTATSRHSRNNRAGFLIGSGNSADDAIKKVGMVVEGIHAIPPALKLAEKYKVDMPIITAVHKTISGELTPDEAVSLLMNREKKSEK